MSSLFCVLLEDKTQNLCAVRLRSHCRKNGGLICFHGRVNRTNHMESDLFQFWCGPLHTWPWIRHSVGLFCRHSSDFSFLLSSSLHISGLVIKMDPYGSDLASHVGEYLQRCFMQYRMCVSTGCKENFVFRKEFCHLCLSPFQIWMTQKWE